jgi:hypothetical protein
VQRKIDFLIIGTPKAGTTALATFLGTHPDIFIPEREVLFFTSDEFYAMGDKYLDSVYKDSGNKRLLGGRSGLLLFMHQLAERVHAYNPDMKVMAILRNPVDRAYSAYWYARRLGWETLPTFEDALAAEDRRSKGTPRERAMSYLVHGHYSEHIKRYIEAFGSDNVRILLSGDLKNAPEETFSGILEWLGLEPDVSCVDLRKRVNEGGVPRWGGIRRFIFAEESKIVNLLRRKLSPERREAIFFRIMRLVEIINVRRDGKYPSMNPETREKLIDYFRPWNENLGALLGRDLDSWNR